MYNPDVQTNSLVESNHFQVNKSANPLLFNFNTRCIPTSLLSLKMWPPRFLDVSRDSPLHSCRELADPRQSKWTCKRRAETPAGPSQSRQTSARWHQGLETQRPRLTVGFSKRSDKTTCRNYIYILTHIKHMEWKNAPVNFKCTSRSQGARGFVSPAIDG